MGRHISTKMWKMTEPRLGRRCPPGPELGAMCVQFRPVGGKKQNSTFWWIFCGRKEGNKERRKRGGNIFYRYVENDKGGKSAGMAAGNNPQAFLPGCGARERGAVAVFFRRKAAPSPARGRRAGTGPACGSRPVQLNNIRESGRTRDLPGSTKAKVFSAARRLFGGKAALGCKEAARFPMRLFEVITTRRYV